MDANSYCLGKMPRGCIKELQRCRDVIYITWHIQKITSNLFELEKVYSPFFP